MNAAKPSPLKLTLIMFWAVHVAALAGIVYLGFSWQWAAAAIGIYFVRMIVVTGAYHRYFSHRSFKTSRWFQFVMALGAQTAAQRGVLWWASQHRYHHKHSDTQQDVHSPRLKGLWHSHVGWVVGTDQDETDLSLVGDLARYPELRFMDRAGINVLPTTLLALAFLLLGGLPGLVWGYFVSTVLLWHGSFTINSLSHLFGKRRYPTSDDSRNNWLLAIVTTGEGWHNNHHHYMSSARQGFRWYEIDVTYYVIKLLSLVGLVWDVRQPPRHVIDGVEPESTTVMAGEAAAVAAMGAAPPVPASLA
jgi:stearoyl-CoA desaturase (Delta-9 desaturase)